MQLEKQVNVYPIDKQSTFSNKYLEEQSYSVERCNRIISNNTKDKISCHNQMNTLIPSSVEHKISNNSTLNLSGFKDYLANNRTTSYVRRASSFHGKDFVDNSSYFDKKIDDLKKTNSHQNIALSSECLQKDNTVSEGLKEISWKDADKYFKSDFRMNTPAPQTGRASVAKLRAQNAGMVLAKARLFDDTTKTSEFTNVSNKKLYHDNKEKRSPNINKEMDAKTEHFKQSYKRAHVSRKQSNKDLKNKKCHSVLSPNVTQQIKTQVTTVSLKPLQSRIDKNRRSTHKFELQNQKLLNKDPTIHKVYTKDKEFNAICSTEMQQTESTPAKTSSLTKIPINIILENSDISPYKLEISKTPHIKRPLTVKTPKSSKLVRRPPVDTRRTPLKATAQLGTPKRQSPKSILKTKTLSMHT